MNKFISVKEAAEMLGVSTQTLRRWEKEKKIAPPKRTKGNQRRYEVAELIPLSKQNTSNESLITLAYARVSSHDQKLDLVRQEKMLEYFCSANGWPFKLISDLGSGLNYNKKGLKQLLKQILNGQVKRLVLTQKDRLLRFGAELIFAICEEKGVEIVLINQGDSPSFEEELAQDVLEIITVFSAKLYGSRSHKNKQLMADLKKAAKHAS